MRRYVGGVWALAMLCLSACGDDADPTTVTDAGPRDASLDGRDGAARDAGVLDAELVLPARDAEVGEGDSKVFEDARVDAASACSLAGGELRYFFSGGFRSVMSSYSVSADGVFRRVRENLGDAGVESCTAALPACGSSGVDVVDLDEALAKADVLSSFTLDKDRVLGIDSRPYDGSVLIIERSDGKRISVGDACTVGQAACLPIPDGVTALSNLLFQLSSEQSAAGPCKSNML